MNLLSGFIVGVLFLIVAAFIAVKIAKVAFFILLIMGVTAACSVKTKTQLAWVGAAVLVVMGLFAALVFFVNS